MQPVAVKLYPASDENGCGNRAYAYAAHSTEVHKGNCQADSDERAVEAVLMMLNLILLIKEITSTIPSPAATKILARIQRKTPKARMMVLRIQSNHCQNNVSGATQSSRLIEKSIQ